LRLINAIKEFQCRNCDAKGINQLLGMISKHKMREVVFNLFGSMGIVLSKTP
jgi:hypothetical protein